MPAMTSNGELGVIFLLVYRPHRRQGEEVLLLQSLPIPLHHKRRRARPPLDRVEEEEEDAAAAKEAESEIGSDDRWIGDEGSKRGIQDEDDLFNPRNSMSVASSNDAEDVDSLCHTGSRNRSSLTNDSELYDIFEDFLSDGSMPRSSPSFRTSNQFALPSLRQNVLEEMCVKLEVVCRTRPRPEQSVFGLILLALFLRLTKMKLDGGDAIGHRPPLPIRSEEGDLVTKQIWLPPLLDLDLPPFVSSSPSSV